MVTGASDGVCFLSEGGELSSPVLLTSTKGEAPASVFLESTVRRSRAITGHRAHPSSRACLSIWARDNGVTGEERPGKVLSPSEYLGYLLTGECHTNIGMASSSVVFDITQRQWSGAIARVCSLDVEALPSIEAFPTAQCQPHELAHGVDVPSRADVLVAPPDWMIAAHLTAGDDLSRVTISFGGGIDVCRPTISPAPVPLKSIDAACDAFSDRYLQHSHLANGGTTLSWLAELFHDGDEDKMIDSCLPEMTKAPPQELFLPFLTASDDGNSPAGWSSLSRQTGCGGLICAALTGIAFSIREVMSDMETAEGEITEVGYIGRHGDKAGWLSLIANALQKPVHIWPTHLPLRWHAGAVGNACRFEAGPVAPEQSYHPTREHAEEWQTRFEQYLALKRAVGATR